MNPTTELFLVAAASDPGRSGKNNEDRFAVLRYPLAWGEEEIPCALAVISDGIGGHRAGEVAAELAVEIVTHHLRQGDPAQPLDTLQEAVLAANAEIYRQAEADPNRRGMGATLACAWLIGTRLYTVTVGDSRIYLLRQGGIRQISTDHTWIQEALASGLLTPEQARGHPNAHVIRRYLGSRQPPVPDFRICLADGEDEAQAESHQGLELQPGEALLVCTDGLTDLVDAAEILAAVRAAPGADAVQALIAAANARGGHDNITLALLERAAEHVPAAPTGPILVGPRRAPDRRAAWSLTCLLTATLLLLGLGALGGAYWWLNRPPPSPTPTNSRTTPLPQPTRPALFLTLDPRLTPTIPPPSPTPRPSRTPRPQTPTVTPPPLPLP
jgi:protein phosphatase